MFYNQVMKFIYSYLEFNVRRLTYFSFERQTNSQHYKRGDISRQLTDHVHWEKPLFKPVHQEHVIPLSGSFICVKDNFVMY